MGILNSILVGANPVINQRRDPKVLFVGGPHDGERFRVSDHRRDISFAAACEPLNSPYSPAAFGPSSQMYETHVYSEVRLTDDIRIFAHSSLRTRESVAEAMVRGYQPQLPQAPEVDWRPNQMLPEDYYAG